jgi:hypothetical protein
MSQAPGRAGKSEYTVSWIDVSRRGKLKQQAKQMARCRVNHVQLLTLFGLGRIRGTVLETHASSSAEFVCAIERSSRLIASLTNILGCPHVETLSNLAQLPSRI